MKAYLISLNEASEKIAYLRSFGIDPILVKGVNGKTAPIEEIEKRVSNSYVTFGPKSAIGCGISHMNTWKMFLETNDQYAIIFEDDVILEDNFMEKLKLCLEEVPEDYDILYLGCTGCDNDQKINIIKLKANLLFAQTFDPYQQVTENVAIPSVAFATHAYVVSRKGATNLLQYLDGNLDHHIDICIQKLVLANKIESYSSTPRIAYQTSTDDTPSANVSSSFPLIASSIMNKIYVDRFYRSHYILSSSFRRIGHYDINGFSILFFFIGLICALKNVDIKKVTIGFFLFSSPDVVMVRSKADLEIILFNYLILVSPYLLKVGIGSIGSFVK